MISRREFFQMLSLAAIAGSSLNLTTTAFGQTAESNGLFPIPSEILTDPVYSFTSSDFTPFINTDFEIRHENLRRAETLRLLSLKEVGQRTNAEGVKNESFSLLFFSPRKTKLKAGQYEFTHFSLGTFMLTINPVSAEPNRFEAVINHLQK